MALVASLYLFLQLRDELMSSYSGYRGQSVGRILHCLDVYCPTNHRLCENASVGDGVVKYHGNIIARYVFSAEGDIPQFEFLPLKGERDSLHKEFEKNQFFYQPYLDNPAAVMNFKFLVQEVRKVLTFEEALIFRHIRDKTPDDWRYLDDKPVADKINKVVTLYSYGTIDVTTDSWKILGCVRSTISKFGCTISVRRKHHVC